MGVIELRAVMLHGEGGFVHWSGYGMMVWFFGFGIGQAEEVRYRCITIVLAKEWRSGIRVMRCYDTCFVLFG